jgi:hypothetical protein
MSDDESAPADHSASSDAPDRAASDLAGLDDSTLFARRRELREQLEREPDNMADLVRAHHLLTSEVVRRTIATRSRASSSRSYKTSPKPGPRRIGNECQFISVGFQLGFHQLDT